MQNTVDINWDAGVITITPTEPRQDLRAVVNALNNILTNKFHRLNSLIIRKTKDGRVIMDLAGLDTDVATDLMDQAAQHLQIAVENIDANIQPFVIDDHVLSPEYGRQIAEIRKEQMAPLRRNERQSRYAVDKKYRRIQNAQHAMQRNFKGRKR